MANRFVNNIFFIGNVVASVFVYDELYIFGPGNTQEQFRNHICKDAQFNSTDFTIHSSVQLTENQMIVNVRTFFEPSYG
jgi:hypothetical protein